MSEDRTWLKAFMEMHLEIQDALKAKNELDEIKLLLKELDVGQVPGYQPLSAIQGIRKLHRAWMQLSQCEVANVKTAVDFMQKNEALRAENAKLRAHAEQLELQCSALREEYTNRGAIIQDFAKREHELQKLVGELDKQIGHMGEIIREFFPASVIPAPWERDGMTIPQGEWVLRSNEALRRRVADLERQCKADEQAAQNWKSIWDRQIVVSARLRGRIAELRSQLKRIKNWDQGSLPGDIIALRALAEDDRVATLPITNFLTQEAK
jgi:cell division protein FtsB